MERKTKLFSICASVLLAGGVFVGCGSSSDSAAPSPTVTETSGVLVDPYIEGAVMCQDTNDNGLCDSDEPTSTATTATGGFTFDKALTAGKNILIKTQGTHEGKTFDLNISGVVDADGKIAVVSPLTTLESRGLTADQIVTILTQAKSDAITGGASNLSNFTISSTTILNDPLNNGLMDKKVSEIDDEDLANIQASLTTYGLLKIMNGSTTLKALTADQLVASGASGQAVNQIATALLTGVSNSLNKSLLNDIVNQISTGRTSLSSHPSISTTIAQSALPEPSVGIIVKVGTKIIDNLAELGYTTCNSTVGTDAAKVSAALTAVGTRASTISTSAKIMEMGKKLYGFTYKSNINTNLGNISGALSGLQSADGNISVGLNATSGVTTFVFDNSGNIVTHSN
jgi:hypothetical protein